MQPSKKLRNKPHRSAPSRCTLERLDSRLLLNGSNEWLTGLDLSGLDEPTHQLLDNLDHLLHPHSHLDGSAGPYFSDPTGWDLSAIFGDHEPSLDDMHQFLDNYFDHDHPHDELSLDADPFTDPANVGSEYVSEELLAVGGGYVLYLDFDGGTAQPRSSDSWLYNYTAVTPAYDLSSYGWAGLEDESIDQITEFVREDYAAYHLSVVTEEPSSGDYTTIFVGGNNDWFQAGSGIIGVATYDIGNSRASNYGFAFTEELSIYSNYSGGNLLNFSEYVANLISHEAGHTFGANHIDDTSALMNPYLPLSPRTSGFGVNNIYGSGATQDTQSLLGSNLGYDHGSDDFADTFAGAATIQTGSSQAAMLERRDDIDVFQFTALASSTLTVDLDTSGYGNLDSVLTVYRASDMGLVAENDDSDGQSDSLLTFSATAGETYYIYVASYDANSSGTYSLLVDADLNWQPDAQIDVGGLDATVVELNPFGDETLYEGLTAVNNQQVYRISLDVFGDMNLTLDDDGFGAYAALYDANGQLLDWDYDGGSEDTAGFSYTGQTWEAYYLVVGSVAESGFGDYGLIIETPNVVSSAIAIDAEGFGTATGSISPGDADYFRVVAPENALGLFISDLNISGNWDAILSLYDSSGQLVSRVDTADVSGDEILAVDSIMAGETYYLRIADSEYQSSGDYDLDVSFALPANEPKIEVTDSLNSLVDHLLDFDPVTVDTTAAGILTISNNGLLDLIVSELTVGSGFSLDSESQSQNSGDDIVIAPGQALTVTVTFMPDQIANYSDQIVIVSNDSAQSVLLVEVSGLSHAPQADIVVTATGQSLVEQTLSLGQVNRGDRLNQILTITNNGLADMSIFDISVENPLSIIGTYDTLLAPGESTELVVEVFADQRGALSAAIEIISNDPDSGEALIQVQAQVLGGILTVHEIAQTPDDNQIDFGAVYVGDLAEQTVSLTNTGDAPLTITAIDASSGFGVSPAATVLNSLDDIVLAVGESINIVAGFTPTTLADAVGSLNISTDNIENPGHSILLSGSTLAGVLQVSELDGIDDNVTDLGRRQVHHDSRVDLWQLSNNGNVPLTVSLSLDVDSDFHLYSDSQVVIPAGGFYVVQVDFNTILARQVSDQLQLASDDFYESSASLSLQADGFARIGGGEKYSFIDHSGDRVDLSLSGDAQAEVIIGQDNEPDISAITLLSASGEESLNIKVKGPGRTLLGELTGQEGLKKISAAKVDLVGAGIHLDAQLQSLRLGNVLGGADIHFQAPEAAQLRLENIVGDSVIDIDGALKQFASLRFSGGQIVADTIDKFSVASDLDAEIHVTDGDLEQLLLRQGSLASAIDVQGRIGKLTVSDGDLLGDVLAQDSIEKISVTKGSIRSSVQSLNVIEKISAFNLEQAGILALNGIDKISVSNAMIDSNIMVGYTQEAAETHGVHATSPIDAYLNSLKVKGMFEASNVAIGVAPDNDGNFLNGFAATTSGTLGKISLGQVQTDNDSDPFGLIARSDIINLKVNKLKIAESYQQDDFYVATLA